MKKQKSEDKEAYEIRTFFLFVLMFVFILLAWQYLSSLENENLQLKNDIADAFCKSQSYEVVVNEERLADTCLKNVTEYYESKYIVIYDKYGSYHYTDLILFFSSKLNQQENEKLKSDYYRIMKNLEKVFYGENITVKDSFSNFTRCLDIIPAKTETYSFNTGFYNTSDNSYYCHAEPTCEKICDIFYENRNDFRKWSICLSNCSSTGGAITNQRIYFYQKVQKFQYE